VCAAENLLAFATADDRESLSILVDRNLIDAEAMDDALAGDADLSIPRPIDWLGFYDPDAIAGRQEDAEDPDDRGEEIDDEDIVPPDPALGLLSRLDAPAAAPPPIVNASPKIGRNDPCPCGSGRKYKKCCSG
jgi:hypothetical protein